MRPYSTVCFFALLFFTALGTSNVAEGNDYELSGQWTKREKATGHSVAPVLGYEPTFGFVFGGAYFFQAPRFSISFDTNTNFKRVYQAHFNVRHETDEDFYWDLHAGVTRGYLPYYGEGGETKVLDFSRLWGTQGDAKLQFGYWFSPIYSVGIFTDARVRTEELGEGSPKNQIAPNETSVGVGIFQEVDSRDDKESPREGFVFRTELSLMPAEFSTRASGAFGQLEGNFVVYKEVLNQVVRDVIAAFQLSGGTTFGTPSFNYVYKLGGANKLRGYLEDRFRGQAYYLQQTELRFPIWELFSGAAFLSFGDTANQNQFTFPKMTYGVGLRIGLPPDWISKIRIDYGVSRDQQGVFANFGQTF